MLKKFKLKFREKCVLKQLIGPFDFPLFPNLQVSPLGLVPKKDGNMHPIHHLPYPKNLSVNDFIGSTAFSVQYSNKDQGAEIKALAGMQKQHKKHRLTLS